jgi:hypothetical protein
MSVCGQTGHWVQTSIGCFIYDFQTLLIGAAAIIVAIVFGIPVWRQLKDTNLQTRISHRETLATLLRDALRRHAKVDGSIREPLSMANRVTSDPIGEPVEIEAEDANHIENMLHGVLDWYLVVLKDTEHSDIEDRKAVLKIALDKLMMTLGEAHWADHNEQHDEDHDIPDDEWAKIVARCAQAKVEASYCVGEVEAAYRTLQDAQQQWVQSLRGQIAELDLQIASPK